MINVKLYSLSTCPWCIKTKKLLDKMNIKYTFVDVDNISGFDRASIIKVVKTLNPMVSYPTIVINDKVIVGFKENQIKKTIEECVGVDKC